MTPNPIKDDLNKILNNFERVYNADTGNLVAKEQIEALIAQSNQQLLDRVLEALPEKKEAKAPYNILDLEKAFQNGRSQALDQCRRVIEKLR